jgi:hypothetical protein
MTKNNEINQFPIHFLETINGKNILFQYDEDVNMPDILAAIVNDICNCYNFPVIYIYNENRTEHVLQKLSADTALVQLSKNLTSTMMRLEKMIFGQKCIIITDKLEDLISSPAARPKVLFLKTLLRKSKENHGIVLSSYKKDSFESAFEKKISGIYDMIFNIDKNKISTKKLSGNEHIYYTFSNNELTIQSTPSSDTDKIKEIFQLTPEEKEELDKIVGEQIKDFDIF